MAQVFSLAALRQDPTLTTTNCRTEPHPHIHPINRIQRRSTMTKKSSTNAVQTKKPNSIGEIVIGDRVELMWGSGKGKLHQVTILAVNPIGSKMTALFDADRKVGTVLLSKVIRSLPPTNESKSLASGQMGRKGYTFRTESKQGWLTGTVTGSQTVEGGCIFEVISVECPCLFVYSIGVLLLLCHSSSR